MPANSHALAELEESSRRYYGWRVVLAANLGVMAGFGSLFVFTFSVFLKPLGAQFGWSREEVSRGFALAAIMVAVTSPILGRWLDRLGPRRIILGCMAVYGCAYASQAFLGPDLWQFYATCIVLGAVGNATTQMGYARAIASWFSARRGMALALVMAGTGAGSIVLPVLAQTFISAGGWRTAYLLLGFLALLLGIPLTWRFVREREHGYAGSRAPLQTGASWRRALRSYSFWIIVAMLMLSSLGLNGAVAHLVALLTDRGISPQRAAWSASVLGGTSLGGRLLVGSLLDRFSGPRVAFVMLLASAGGIFLLARAGSLPAGCLAAALMGLGLGGEADITPYLLTRYFGLRSFSTLYGVTWTFYAVAGGLGPVVMGRAYDLTGSYTALLHALGIGATLAAALMLLLPRYSSSPLTDSYA